MQLSYAEAVAQVTGPESLFATTEIDLDGNKLTAFAYAPASLRDLLSLSRGRGDTTFLVYEDERWSFDDVWKYTDALAALLVERYGVAKGDRVAIGMRNYPEWVISFAAIHLIGAICVSLNAWWTEDELDYGLDDSAPKVLIADAERAERAHASAERLGVRTIVVRVEGELPAGTDRWDEVLAPGLASGAVPPQVDIQPDDDATILYTSGTTGRPKGAVSTQRAVVHAVMGFGCRAAIDRARDPDDKSIPDPTAGGASFILIVPLFHVTGCVAVMISSFVAGIKLVMMHKWEPERALQLIERERVTNFVGVPTQSWDLLESPAFAKYDTSSLVSVGGGGAPAPPELVKRVARSFKTGRPNIGYGLTETNAYGPQNNGLDYLEHPTSTGRSAPILQIEVRDADGVTLPAGELGEIWFHGPTLIRGYWNRPEDTADTIVKGWLRTGDLGRIDDEGFVYVVDRAKDMVLRAGENVYCAEVEAAIYEHPAVYEAAVFGVPHERLGEEVAAAVFLRDGEQVTAEDLRQHVASRLAPFKVPTKVMFVHEQLPRNASGKILKRELRDQLIDDADGS